MSALTSPRSYAVLAAFQAGDAVACAIPVVPITQALDTLEVPAEVRWVLPATKAASVVGLLAVRRLPWLARLTTALLTVYFVLAIAAHLRVRDKPVNIIPAATFLATYAAMTVKGPDVAR